ncbi:hydantoinase B/oxoprolinase family protein [Methylobacterium currus]|uniref:Hydantoinase B/oxoprolinase family protein n=1 Tax=Methylobacterium currus TaxID=2051553 RepID=A0A2R4WWF8_9HYPH|nr:hydantoinase B/oxoprolinase family protein [Methylobacterium currus]AWB25865.1 hydantoinase B/oxoprolinase family protein [Methylobacterium currus]UHC19504.1 hydantoinase B/oxoprolinase family protein [Methylobacterium currus]
MTSTIAMDGVTLALINSRLEGVVRKMANTLLRTGRSGVLNIARDFSCCLLTAEAELLVANEALPIHTLSGPDIMARSMTAFHPDLRRGDAFLNNSPYHGCSHAADHTILMPVVDDEGRHRFTVLCKAHQADIGNSLPTTYHGTARDVYEEGALIFPGIKVQSGYAIDPDVERMCRLRIRVPDQWWGDFLAMNGAAQIGEQEMLRLAAEIGWDTLDRFARDWLDYSERRMIAAIRTLPGGETSAVSVHDPIPGTPAEGIAVRVAVAIDPEAARIRVDLTDNIDCLPCGLNLSEACARTSAMIGVFNAIDPGVPKNAGSFRRLDVSLRENCVVGIPRHPTSTSAATTNLADRVANGVQRAIAELADGIGLAECGAGLPASTSVVSGIHPETGPFINQLFLGLTGGAAAARTDAWLTICHVGNAGLCSVDSVELDEQRQPLVVHARRLLPDTEGAGAQVGARSCEVEFGPVGCTISAAYVSDGEANPPQGVRGGLPGHAASQSLVDAEGRVSRLPNCAQVTVRPGERIRSVSTGGGGYGDPRRRDPDLVRRDVAALRISPERARTVYGVEVVETPRPA